MHFDALTIDAQQTVCAGAASTDRLIGSPFTYGCTTKRSGAVCRAIHSCAAGKCANLRMSSQPQPSSGFATHAPTICASLGPRCRDHRKSGRIEHARSREFAGSNRNGVRTAAQQRLAAASTRAKTARARHRSPERSARPRRFPARARRTALPTGAIMDPRAAPNRPAIRQPAIDQPMTSAWPRARRSAASARSIAPPRAAARAEGCAGAAAARDMLVEEYSHGSRVLIIPVIDLMSGTRRPRAPRGALQLSPAPIAADAVQRTAGSSGRAARCRTLSYNLCCRSRRDLASR